MNRIKMQNNLSLSDAFESFIFSKSAEGVSQKTLSNYKEHLNTFSKDLDPTILLSNLTKKDVQDAISKMRKRNISQNTIASYVRVFRTFLSWARMEGLTDVSIPMFKTEETVKDVYTDSELSVLLKKPNLHKCKFSEYRDWVIINFLLNSGARTSTIICIQVQDVDLPNSIISYRHNKNKHVQVILKTHLLFQLLLFLLKTMSCLYKIIFLRT